MRLPRMALDYVEQPCATAGVGGGSSTIGCTRWVSGGIGAGIFHRIIPVRIAADECIRKSTDPLTAVTEVIDTGACDVVVLKVPPLGGVARLLDIARTVAPRGVAVTVSSALDTGIGLGAVRRLPACLRWAQYPKQPGWPRVLCSLRPRPRPIVNGRIQSASCS